MCVLRVLGDSFDSVTFLKDSSLSPYDVFSIGDKASPHSARVHKTSGFQVEVSAADWNDRESQFKDALDFLRRHDAERRRLVGWPGVELVLLDFPFDYRTGLVTFIRCPLELAREASVLGVELEFSMYPTSEDETE